MRREYPEFPIVGVAAVVFSRDMVLLAQRGHDPGRGRWSLPGGAVELGEPLVNAVKREVFEETAVKIHIGGLVDVFDRIFRDGDGRVKYHYVLINYWGWVVSGTPLPGSDVAKVRFVPLAGLNGYNIGEELKGVIAKASGMRKGMVKKVDGSPRGS
jgi:ADP-ribose pyrophosphatase YjhB (NUDIX family)